jgi:NAD(P)-dependent dehydrogenase (short-subunit alcohol dehydrogenase family)
MQNLLRDKVAIINGGTTGMGRSTAMLFAQEGCSCVIAGRNEKNGRQTAGEATARGSESIFMPCDVTDLRQIKDCVDRTLKKFGKVDILVGCAGSSIPRGSMKAAPDPIARPRRGIQYTDEKFYDVMMDLNLKGQVFFCKEVAPYMIKQNSGKIVLISSMGVFNPPAASIEYHTAKAGILGLTYNLAFELGPHNINVNAILPGPIITPFYDPILAALPESERKAYLENMGKNTPLGRAGTPEDIANVVLFLSSELSSYMTGQALNVSGGMPLGRYREGGFGTTAK